MTNKIACLKSIAGRLPNGAHFIAGKNEYAVVKYSGVKLVKYNNKSKKATLKSTTYGQCKYNLKGVGSNAFATKAGGKVTAITLDAYITDIAKNAFSKTKSLKKLTFKDYWWKRVYTSDYKKVKKVKVADGYSIAKKAFAKCGKGGGKGLTVVFGRGVDKKEAGKFKSLLASKGMSKSVKIKTW